METSHYDQARLEALHAGRLGLEDTAAANEHIRHCAACRAAYRDIACNRSLAPDPEMLARFPDFIKTRRDLAADELCFTLPEPIHWEQTPADRLLETLGSEHADRFLLTSGNLDALLQEVAGNMKKLGRKAPITPEGEKSYVAFLAQCVEANVKQLATADTPLEFDSLQNIFEQLQSVASGQDMGLAEHRTLSDARDAFREKAHALLNAFRAMAGGA